LLYLYCINNEGVKPQLKQEIKMVLQVKNTSTGNLTNLKFNNGIKMMRYIETIIIGSHYKLSVVENGKTTLRGRDEIMKISNFI